MSRETENALLLLVGVSAGIITVSGAYTRYVPAFETLFELSGRDFERFYQAVAEVGARARAARETRLRQLMGLAPKAQRREALRKSL